MLSGHELIQKVWKVSPLKRATRISREKHAKDGSPLTKNQTRDFLEKSMIFVDLIQDALELGYLESLIVAALFIRGGYATMQFLEEHLGISGVTLSALIAGLSKKTPPLVRKNEERSPVPLVLLISPTEFARQCQAKREKIFDLKEKYLDFLREIAKAKDRSSARDHLRAVLVALFSHDVDLGLILACLHEREGSIIEKRLLFERIHEKSNLSWNRFNTILSARTDLITVHTFSRKSFVKARFSLHLLTLYLENLLQLEKSDFYQRLDMLQSLESKKYEDVIPYYYVGSSTTPSDSLAIAKELNRRLKLHLNHYSQVLIIWNGIYQGETRVLHVISRSMTSEHRVSILTTQSLPNIFKSGQKVLVREVDAAQLPPDFRTHDILVFGKNDLYYSCFFLDRKEAFNDITPSTINEVVEVFRRIARDVSDR